MDDKKTILASRWTLMSAYFQLKSFLFDNDSKDFSLDDIKKFYVDFESNISILDYFLGNPLSKSIK